MAAAGVAAGAALHQEGGREDLEAARRVGVGGLSGVEGAVVGLEDLVAARVVRAESIRMRLPDAVARHVVGGCGRDPDPPSREERTPWDCR